MFTLALTIIIGHATATAPAPAPKATHWECKAPHALLTDAVQTVKECKEVAK